MRVMIIESTTIIGDVADIEMLMLAKNQLKVIDEGYQEIHLEAPEWVGEKLAEVKREISFRVKAELQRQLKMAKARRAAEAPKEEKLVKLDTKIAGLEKQLKDFGL